MQSLHVIRRVHLYRDESVDRTNATICICACVHPILRELCTAVCIFTQTHNDRIQIKIYIKARITFGYCLDDRKVLA